MTDWRPVLWDDQDMTEPIEDVKLGTYHGIDENIPSYDCVGCPIKICRYSSSGHQCGWVENPAVTLDGIEDLADHAVVDLPPILEDGPGAAMVSIDNGPAEEFRDGQAGKWNKPDDKFWLRDNAAVDPSDCAGHPNVRADLFVWKFN